MDRGKECEGVCVILRRHTNSDGILLDRDSIEEEEVVPAGIKRDKQSTCADLKKMFPVVMIDTLAGDRTHTLGA